LADLLSIAALDAVSTADQEQSHHRNNDVSHTSLSIQYHTRKNRNAPAELTGAFVLPGTSPDRFTSLSSL
jgi:hypothetical protein